MVIDDDLFCGLSWNWERIALRNLMAHIYIYIYTDENVGPRRWGEHR